MCSCLWRKRIKMLIWLKGSSCTHPVLLSSTPGRSRAPPVCPQRDYNGSSQAAGGNRHGLTSCAPTPFPDLSSALSFLIHSHGKQHFPLFRLGPLPLKSVFPVSLIQAPPARGSFLPLQIVLWRIRPLSCRDIAEGADGVRFHVACHPDLYISFCPAVIV